jgi:hypothetical protein
MMEFHVARKVRDRLQFSDELFSLSGNVVFANFHAARVFAQKMNDSRDLVHFPERTVRAGHINAMGLIDEILHFMCGLYREQVNPQAMAQAAGWLEAKVGAATLDKAIFRFTEEFPPLAVYRGEVAADAYLKGTTDGVPHRQLVLEEMLMLWLANVNPAFEPFLELFDDSALEKETAYVEVIAGLGEFFAGQPVFGPEA